MREVGVHLEHRIRVQRIERVTHAPDVGGAQTLSPAGEEVNVVRATAVLAHDVCRSVRGIVVHHEYVHLVGERWEDSLQLIDQPADVLALVKRGDDQDNAHLTTCRVLALARFLQRM